MTRKSSPCVTTTEYMLAENAWRIRYENAAKVYARDVQAGDLVIFKSKEEIDNLDGTEDVYYFPVIVTNHTTKGIRVVALANELSTSPYAFYLKRMEPVVRLTTELV